MLWFICPDVSIHVSWPSVCRFKFSDYLQRLQVIKTFNVRFRPWTTGQAGCPYDLQPPKRWTKAATASASSSRNSSAVPVPVPTNTYVPPAPPTRRKVFDEETETWVEVCTASVLMHICTCPYAYMHLSWCSVWTELKWSRWTNLTPLYSTHLRQNAKKQEVNEKQNTQSSLPRKKRRRIKKTPSEKHRGVTLRERPVRPLPKRRESLNLN